MSHFDSNPDFNAAATRRNIIESQTLPLCDAAIRQALYWLEDQDTISDGWKLLTRGGLETEETFNNLIQGDSATLPEYLALFLGNHLDQASDQPLEQRANFAQVSGYDFMLQKVGSGFAKWWAKLILEKSSIATDFSRQIDSESPDWRRMGLACLISEWPDSESAEKPENFTKNSIGCLLGAVRERHSPELEPRSAIRKAASESLEKLASQFSSSDPVSQHLLSFNIDQTGWGSAGRYLVLAANFQNALQTKVAAASDRSAARQSIMDDLVSWLEDSDPNFQVAASIGLLGFELEQSEIERIAQRIEAPLYSKENLVRSFALLLLAHLGSKNASDMAGIVSDVAVNDSDPQIARLAIMTLGQILPGLDESVNKIRALANQEPERFNRLAELSGVAGLLGRSTSAKNCFVRALQNSDPTRVLEAISALRYAPNWESIESLDDCTEDIKDPRILAAIRGLQVYFGHADILELGCTAEDLSHQGVPEVLKVWHNYVHERVGVTRLVWPIVDEFKGR